MHQLPQISRADFSSLHFFCDFAVLLSFIIVFVAFSLSLLPIGCLENGRSRPGPISRSRHESWVH